jgi:transcriptional regulator with XRE-family HTH domain
VTAVDVPEPVDSLGSRLRASRQASGLSLRELARRLGVSPSFVSQIENGKSQPSVATLYSLSQVLGFSIDGLFHGAAGAVTAPAEPAATEVDAGPQPTTESGTVSRSSLGSPAHAFGALSHRGARISTTRPGARSRIIMDSGVVWEQLVDNTGDDLDFIEIIYPPHSSSTNDQRMLQHAGYEYGYLLEGQLEITVGFDTFVVLAGDAVGFDSAVPHLFRNQGEVAARGVWFVRHAH